MYTVLEYYNIFSTTTLQAENTARAHLHPAPPRPTRHGLQGRGLRRETIAATQTFDNGQNGHHSIATRGPGTEVRRRKPPRESRHRSRGTYIDRTGRPSRACNRSPTAAPSSSSTPQWRSWSTCGSSELPCFATFGPRPASVDSPREIQYWNLVYLISAVLLLSKYPYLDDGWPCVRKLAYY